MGSQALQYSIKCLQNAYDRFFAKIAKFPRFKKCSNRQSFRIPQGIKITNNKLIIPKFLEGITIVLHRKLEGKIEFATISKNKAGRYFVSITVSKEIEKLTKSKTAIGVDLNVKEMVDSNNVAYINPRLENKYKQQLKILSKAVSRKNKDSNNRRKAQLRLNKLKQYIHNIREDFLHKLSIHIINENQVICVEDLNVESMLKKVATKEMPRWKQRKLHRAILDCGFARLVEMLIYKALWYRRDLIKVSQWFPSSQLCNHCGWQYKDLPKDCQEWLCLMCWEINDRNYNAAMNILHEGLRIAGIARLAYCPDVRPSDVRQLVG